MDFEPTKLAKKLPGKGTGLYYDPLYDGYVPLPHYLRQAMDLDVFQRLQGIKQLSTVYLTFRGAVHTRFVHSVGTAYLASVLFNRLREVAAESKGDDDFPDMNPVTEAAMCLAALFHDVGHGPFGHIFEMYCRRVPAFKDWTHEKMARKLITGQDEAERDISQPAFTQIKTLLKEIQATLEKTLGPKPANIALLNPLNIYRIASGEAPDLGSSDLNNRYSFLKDIIASPYGLDRLDYLRRDAYYSGVNTGNVDIGEIIANVIIKKHEDKHELFLKPECMPALETLLQARNLVYRRLYHDSVHRSAQELVIRGLSDLRVTDPESICLLTDDGLLARFSERLGSLSAQISERVRCRVLDERIPLCSHWDIKESAPRLGDYTTTAWDRLQGCERSIAEKAGMPSDSVFYDIEIIPAVKRQDFEAKVFYDTVGGEPHLKSLFDLAPHLEMIYGENKAYKVDGARQYNESVSRIIVCFPYSAIAANIEGLYNETDADLEAGINALYEDRLKPLVEGFFVTILGWKKEELAKPVNADRFAGLKEQGVHYLRELIGQHAA